MTTKFTRYQERQLLHIHLEGDFQYKTENGTRVPRKAWIGMVDALTNSGYIEIRNGVRVTPKGMEYLGL
jgi:hypothetical protein